MSSNIEYINERVSTLDDGSTLSSACGKQHAKNGCRNHLTILIVIALFFISCVGASAIDAPNNIRQKREGFGPWEPDETLNTMSRLLSKVVEEEKRILNATLTFLEVEEEAIKEKLVGKLRVLFWIALIVVIASAIRLSWPVISFFLRAFYYLIRSTLNALIKTTCLMWVCSLAPFRWIRTKHAEYRKRRRDLDVELHEAEVLSPTCERTTSPIYYDQFGPYVKGIMGDKVYFADRQLTQNSFLGLASAPSFEGFKEERVKETMLARSIPRFKASLPAFQGYFTVDGIVIGHFCRISYAGKSALMTAYHVLSYNRKADVMLNANGKAIRLDDIEVVPLAFSTDTDFDYLIFEVSDTICSRLGLQKAKMATHLNVGSPILINQIIDGKPCYTLGMAMKADRPWMITYAASTVEGSSGAPILNIRHEVVGVHIEGGKSGNTGVIPELLRSRKETAQNGDTNAEDPESHEETPEERDARLEAEAERREQQIEDELALEEYDNQKYYQYKADHEKAKQETKGKWGEMMEWMDEQHETKHEAPPVKIYVTDTGKLGAHVNQRIKGKRYRKESPWTCSKCLTLHLKAGYSCVKCGMPLVHGVKQAMNDKKDAIKGTFPVVVEDKILQHIDALQKKLENMEMFIKGQLTNQNGGHSVIDAKLIRKSLDFPKEVSVDRKLARALDTSPYVGDFDGDIAVKINPANQQVKFIEGSSFGDIRGSRKQNIEVVKRTPKTVIKTQAKETTRVLPTIFEEADFPPLKRKRVRRRKPSNKETVTKGLATAVPLNPISPPAGGAISTSGQNQRSSPKSRTSSVAANTSSSLQNRPRRVTTGEKPKSYAQAVQSSPGLPEGLRLRK